MSELPLVSVVLPFYRSPDLPVAIDSILAQTDQRFELILVDNNSPEEIAAMARSYQSHPRVKVIHEPRQGVTYAMNLGINHASGAYIMRMDSDDYSYPDRIEHQLAALQSDPQLGVVSGMISYVGPDINEGFRVYVDWLNGIRTHQEIALNQFIEFPLVNPSVMFRKDLFVQHGLFQQGDFPEDYEFFLRLQAKRVKMGKVIQPVLRWKDSETRLTRTDARYAQEAFFRIKAKYLAAWLHANNPYDPQVVVWGAGRVSRKRSSFLTQYGIEVIGYIDVKKGPNVLHYSEVTSDQPCFIVSYVANRGARDEIRSFLISLGWTEGKQFILAS